MGSEGTNNGRIEFNVTSEDNAVSSLTQQLAFQHLQQLSGQEHGPQGASVTFFEAQSSYRPRILHVGQKKVSCTFPGCSKMMKKDGLTRHLSEVHFRVVKGVCTRCGKTFPRPYLRRNHEVKCRDWPLGRSRSALKSSIYSAYSFTTPYPMFLSSRVLL